MKITINRPDLITKKIMKSILKQNTLFGDVHHQEFYEGWNQCIEQMIEVLEREET